MKELEFNFAIVLNPSGYFGGAQKRYTNLFFYFYKRYSKNCFYFLSKYLYNQLESIFPNFPFQNVYVIDIRGNSDSMPRKNREIRTDTDAYEIDKKGTILRKIYWFYKNYYRQFLLYREIENYRNELDIKVFMGVFSGILPLYFYLKQKKRKVAVIFSDMDSWFSEVHTDMKKLWYRKYYSFNYGLENSDYIDFLSPFIMNGVKERGIQVKDESVSITPCSFIDYSNCRVGEKKNFEIAFVARLEPDKNPFLYLKAISIITKKYKDVRFHLLGDGSLFAKIREYIEENNLSSRVNFGFHKNPPEILAETSVLVSIQTTNNYPSQSVLEAMVCGNAIIASDVGDTRMFVNEKNGLLIDLELNSLVTAIEKLITNRELTRRMGIYAREYVINNHTIEKVIEYYSNLFNLAYDKVFKRSII